MRDTHWKRLDGVDLLRGLAIFFVLMNHANMQLLFAHVLYLRMLPGWLGAALVWNGQRGVQIFFAISGFLITATTLRRWSSLPAIGVRDFYKLRFARIAPLLLALLAVLSLLDLLHCPNFVVRARDGGLANALFAALTFHVNVLEARRGYLPGSWDILWSLSVEETFYFFFPVACKLLGRTRLFFVMLFVLIALGPVSRTVLSHGNEVWHEYSYLGAMDAIAMGCLTAMLLFSRPLTRTTQVLFTLAGTGLMLLSLFSTGTIIGHALDHAGLDMTLLAVATCMLIAVAAQNQWKAPALLRPLLWMGRRSYEIYLTHMFLVIGLAAAFRALHKPMWMVPLLFLAVIVSATLLGELVARFYSEPMNHWIRRRFAPARLTSHGTQKELLPETALPAPEEAV